MGIACKINRDSKGTPISVTTEKGADSILFKEALKLVKDPFKALNLYTVSHLLVFKEKVSNPLVQKHKRETLEALSRLTSNKEITIVSEGNEYTINTANIKTAPARIEGSNTETIMNYSYDLPNGESVDMGFIQLKESPEGYQVIFSNLNESLSAYNNGQLETLQGKGIGTEMYKQLGIELIGAGETLYSDFSYTPQAEGVWKKMEKAGLASQTTIVDNKGKAKTVYQITPNPSQFDKNGEPKLSEITKYIGEQSRADKKLTFKQTQDIKNALRDNSNLKQDIVNAYITDGLFYINRQKLLESGLYSLPEVNEIISNAELQNEIKASVKAYLNTLDEVLEPQYSITRSIESRGGRRESRFESKVNPEKIVRLFNSNTVFKELSSKDAAETFGALERFNDIAVHNLSPTIRELETFTKDLENKIGNGEISYDLIEDETGVTKKDIELLLKKSQRALDKATKIAAQVDNNSSSPVVSKSLITPIINRLKKTGLAINTFVLSNEGIKNKLKSIGVNENVLNQIIGEKGAQNLDNSEEVAFRLESLSIAREMETTKTPKEIKITTNWERGSDNKWRYEVPDVEFSIEEVELGKEYKYTDIVKANKFTKAYPELNNIKVIFNDRGRNEFRVHRNSIELSTRILSFSASLWEGSRELSLDGGKGYMRRLSADSLRNLIHESTHFVQEREGFSGGGNTDVVGEEARRLSEIEGESSKEVQLEKVNITLLKDNLTQSDRNVLEAYKIALQGDYVGFSNKGYRSIAGEVEARNMEKRSSMSMEDRRSSLLEDTADVSPQDQIFLRQDNIQFQVDLNQPFYSNALKGISQITQKVATPEQWVKTIADKGGRGTNQELEWIGLSDYLNEYIKENNSKSVPKDIVEQYIKDNQIEIVEVTKGNKGKNLDFGKLEGNLLAYMEAEVEEGTITGTENGEYELNGVVYNSLEDLLEYLGKGDVNTKYSNYQLQGGENYREVLLTMPAKDTFNLRYNIKQDTDGNYFLEEKSGNVVRQTNIKNAQIAEDNFRKEFGKEGDKYRSGHWDEGNILAFVRMADFTLPDGSKVLMLNEVQSDWSQDGKKEGFKTKELIKIEAGLQAKVDEINKIERELEAFRQDKLNKLNEASGLLRAGGYVLTILPDGEVVLERVVNNLGLAPGEVGDFKVRGVEGAYYISDKEDDSSSMLYYTKELAEKTLEEKRLDTKSFRDRPKADESTLNLKELEALNFEKDFYKAKADFTNSISKLLEGEDKIGHRRSRMGEGAAYVLSEVKAEGVPDSPYKKTDQWVSLSIRRVMQMAAQEGYDRVSWVTGEQSADRYDLSKQVDYIEKSKATDNSSYVDISMPTTIINLKVNNETGEVIDQSGRADFGDLIGKNLEDVIGKEIAKKVLESKEEKRFEGLDLKVGGEGMKTFYNSILPKVIKKEAQRFDKKATIDVIDFQAGLPFRLKATEASGFTIRGSRVLGSYSGGLNPQEEIKRVAEKFDLSESDIELQRQPKEGDKDKPQKQLSIKLTDKLKSSLQQPVPLFQIAQSGITLTPKGFVFQDEVYLNEDKMSMDTPLHEFGHLWNNWTKETSPEVYQKGIELIQKQGQQYIDFVKKNQPNLKGAALLDEALAQAIGDRGAKIINKSKKNSFTKWLTNLWEVIKNSLGLSEYTADQVQNMNLGEFADAVAIDLLKGKNIGKFIQPEKDTTKVNSLGLYESTNPFLQEKEVVQLLGGIKDRSLFEDKLETSDLENLKSNYFEDPTFAEEFFEEMSVLNRIREFKITDGKLSRKNNSETKALLEETLIVGVENGLNESITYLETLPEDIWQNNSEDIVTLLEDIREKAVGIGLNLNGLEDSYINKTKNEVISLLNSVKNVNLQPNNLRLEELTSLYDEFFQSDKSGVNQIELLPKEHREKSLIYLKSDLSEYELFNNHSLLRVRDNVYQKVDKDGTSLETLTQALTIDNAAKFIEKGVTNLETPNFSVDNEVLQKMFAFKIYFNLEINNQQSISEDTQLKEYSNFTGNLEYLQTDFVADFNKNSVKELQKESESYTNFYTHFKITNKGIELNNTDPISMEQIKDYLNSNEINEKTKENLLQYSIVSKSLDLSSLLETNSIVKTEEFYRDFYTNNPIQAPKAVGQYSVINESTIAAKGNPKFIRTPKGVFEAVTEVGGQSIYKKLPESNTDFNQFNIEQPELNLDLSKFNHLQTAPSKVVKAKNYYSNKELAEIDNQFFNC